MKSSNGMNWLTREKRETTKKSIKKVSKEIYDYGDPYFVDLRKPEHLREIKKESFIDSIVESFNDLKNLIKKTLNS